MAENVPFGRFDGGEGRPQPSSSLTSESGCEGGPHMVGRRSKSARSWNDLARRGSGTGKEEGPQTGEQARRSGSRGGHRELEGVRGSAMEPGRRTQRRVRSPQKRRPDDIEGLGGFPRSLDSGLPPRKGGRRAARATWPAFHIGEVLEEFGVRFALRPPHRLRRPDHIHQDRTRPPLTASAPPEPLRYQHLGSSSTGGTGIGAPSAPGTACWSSRSN